MKIKLTGLNAVVALAAVVAFVVIRFNMQSAALQTDGVEEVERWLALEAARVALPDLEKAVNQAGSEQYLERMVNDLGEENFEVVSVTRHRMGKRIVARVEYRYKGESPSDGTDVRFLRMSYSMATGWRVQSETSELSYYLAAF